MNYMIFLKLIELYFLSSQYSISQCLHYWWAVRTAEVWSFNWNCWSFLEMSLRTCNFCVTQRKEEGSVLWIVASYWKCLLYSALLPSLPVNSLPAIEVRFIPWSLFPRGCWGGDVWGQTNPLYVTWLGQLCHWTGTMWAVTSFFLNAGLALCTDFLPWLLLCSP